VSQSERHRNAVEQIDRRHRGWVRAGLTAGSALLGAVLLWNADVRLGGIEGWIHPWHHGVAEKRAAVIPKPRSVAAMRRSGPTGRMGTDASASKTPLRLVLVRTLPGPNAHSGQAMIGVDVGHPQTYLAGAILENGARLDEIYTDHVVLVKGSARRSLYVESSGVSSPQSPQTAEALEVVGGSSPKPELAHYSVEPVTDYLRPVPIYREGVVSGFQVFPGTRAGAFRKWGLQPGDVITDLDGQPLTDADQAMQLLRSLTDGEALTATIRRGAGEPFQVALDGADLEPVRTATAVAPAGSAPVGP
jgi:type II secretion system protein C